MDYEMSDHSSSKRSSSSRRSSSCGGSRSSSSSRGSGSYTSSRTSMSSSFDPAEGQQYRRVPDYENKYLTSKSVSSSRRVLEVHDHLKSRYIGGGRRASGATYEDYKKDRSTRRGGGGGWGGGSSGGNLYRIDESAVDVGDPRGKKPSGEIARWAKSVTSIPNLVGEESVGAPMQRPLSSDDIQNIYQAETTSSRSVELLANLGDDQKGMATLAFVQTGAKDTITNAAEARDEAPSPWPFGSEIAIRPVKSTPNTLDRPKTQEHNINDRVPTPTSPALPSKRAMLPPTHFNVPPSLQNKGQKQSQHLPAHERKSSNVTRKLQHYQRDMSSQAHLSAKSSPGCVAVQEKKKPSSPRLVRAGSSGRITPLELEMDGEERYLVAGYQARGETSSHETRSPQVEEETTVYPSSDSNAEAGNMSNIPEEMRHDEGPQASTFKDYVLNSDYSSISSSDCHSSDSEPNASQNASIELSERLVNSHLEGEQIILPILDPARQAMVDRVMEEFWVIFNQQWPSSCQEHAGDSSSDSKRARSTITHSNTTQTHSLPRKRQRKDDEEDPEKGSRGGNGRPPSPSTPSEIENVDPPKFACPFRKHDPCRYNIFSHQLCALSHWPSIGRVKEHLYRKHQRPLYCERCWQTFNNQQRLTAHITLDANEICKAKPGVPPAGLTPELERKLRSRKKAHRDQAEEDRWRDMYRLLFPGEDVPSPYFEPPKDEAPLSPDSRALADYEEYARRELPRLVRERVLEVLSREMQPVEASLLANLIDTIQECQARTIRSYQELISDDQGDGRPSSSVGDVPMGPQTSDAPALMLSPLSPLAEGRLMDTPSNFLSTTFQHPPLLQNTDLQQDFTHYGSMNSFQASHALDASLSSSSIMAFSNNGSSSERLCSCPSYCNHTSTTISSQSQAATDTACHPTKPDMQDEASKWRDWFGTEPPFEEWLVPE